MWDNFIVPVQIKIKGKGGSMQACMHNIMHTHTHAYTHAKIILYWLDINK